MNKSIKDQIEEHIGRGYCYFNSLGSQLRLGSSADRRCRELVENNPKYSYFMVKPKGKGSPYKAFIRSLVKCIIVEKIEGLWHVKSYYNPIKYVQSKGFKTQREAMKSIKGCGV